MKPYFSHDVFARENLKIKRLIKKHKMEGYGIFWAIAEFLHNNSNKINADELDLLACDLGVKKEKLESIIYDFNLFSLKKNVISSKRVAQNLKLQKEKSRKARESAMARWHPCEPDSSELRTKSARNAKKEKKEKETKENKKKKENFFGTLNNVFLSPSHFSSLSSFSNDTELINTVIDELSENIALKKEPEYKPDCPDFHFLRLQKYVKQKLSLKPKKSTSPVISSQKTLEYLEKLNQEEGVAPPPEFFKSKENLIKKIMEEKNDTDK